ncbi:MAG TPA: helix-hairpin-helix domain-containing protein [Gemmatimonadales bacterium]|nr:helix-hairpin-helix domain-containing protein [Gemmatimonadales bacterium]
MGLCTGSGSRWSTEVAAVFAIAALAVARGGEAQLPEGPGREETARLCSQCHRVEQAVSLRQDRAGWAATLRKMTALGAKGTDQELAAVLDYLVMHFTAEERPRINVNTATAIELETGLTLRRSQAAAIIAYRAEHGAFKSFEDLKKVPGLDVAQLEAKKDRLTF